MAYAQNMFRKGFHSGNLICCIISIYDLIEDGDGARDGDGEGSEDEKDGKDEEAEEDKADDDASEKSSSDGTEKFEIVN